MPYVIQRALALVLLLLLGPLILALAIVVRLTSRGPAFHRATRVRPSGTFTLYKLRSMTSNAHVVGPGITARRDIRVTRFGRMLRRTKLDELPQLWNVVRGDMALVGPRPEDPRYVDLADPLHARVFGAMPGITGPTALAYRDEDTILQSAAEEIGRSHGRPQPAVEDLERAYRELVLPSKLALDRSYLETRSAAGDLSVLAATIRLGSERGMGQLGDGLPLDYFIEWGGAPWRDLVVSALESMGSLHGKRVLEVGFRSGRMASLLALRGATVVGLDITEYFASNAAVEARRHGVEDQITFVRDDGKLGSVAGERFRCRLHQECIGGRQRQNGVPPIHPCATQAWRSVRHDRERQGWSAGRRSSSTPPYALGF